MSEYIVTSSGELYHAGVKGMKWGVRKDDNKTSGPHKGASRKQSQKTKKKSGSNTAAKVKKGEQYTNKISGKKVATIVSSTAAVVSGALWAASVFMPGAAGSITVVRGLLSAGTAAMSLADNIGTQKSSSRK